MGTEPLSPEFIAWAVKAHKLLAANNEASWLLARDHMRSNQAFCFRVVKLTQAEYSSIIQAYLESLEQSPAAQPETQPPLEPPADASSPT